jgi:hypothetical protein
LRAASALLTLLCLAPSRAQQPASPPKAPPAPTGSVIGHVDYAITQLPARFAQIHLVPKPTEADLAPIAPQPSKPGDPPHQNPPHLTLVTGTSDMEGNFRLDGVPPGDYLAAAAKPGYVLPGTALLEVIAASDEQLKAMAASFPTVHVSVGQTSVVNLTLHRGATISGRILFADGSPAIAAVIGADPSEDLFRQHPELGRKSMTPFQDRLTLLGGLAGNRSATTDDEGHFRIFGLAPGTYVLSTTILLDHHPARLAMTDGSDPNSSKHEQMSSPEMIRVFAPGTFRRSEAKIVEIRGDEQISGADLIIDASNLHTLKGKVFAGEDHHAPNGAMVTLQDQAAKDIGRFVSIGEDGLFQFHDLPSGTYTLTIEANDLNDPDTPGPMVARGYKTATLTAIIAEHDVTLDDVLVIPLKPGEQQKDFPF